MASLIYNNTFLLMGTGALDLTEGQDDIRVALLMTNTSADTEEEIALMNGFSTLDEMDGANYARKTLASQAIAVDMSNDRVEFDCEDLTWSSLGNGTRAIQGMLLLKHVTNDTDSIPLAFIEFASTQNPGGSDFTVNMPAEGLIQIRQGS